MHAVYLINRIPTPILHNKSPYEVLYKKAHFLGHLRVFGCLVYASTIAARRSKFDPRARQCVLLGIPSGLKGYKFLDLKDNQVFISRNVVFHESILPFRHDSHTTVPSFDPTTSPQIPISTSHPPIHAPGLSLPPTLPTPVSPSVDGGHYIPPTTEESAAEPINDDTEAEPYSHQDFDLEVELDPELEPQQDFEPSKRPQRSHKLPAKFDNCELDPDLSFGAFGSCATASKYPIEFDLDHLNAANRAFALSVISQIEPATFYEAMQSYVWNRAVQEELGALEQNQTWDVVKLPDGKKAIGYKWVFKIKRRADGTIERFKVRLVAKGYTQVYGIDFLDTFSPVAKINSVKALLAVAEVKNWTLEQLDVSNAFLHGDLEEEVYMKIPMGLDLNGIDPKGMACRLKKSLYGLKQASRQWFAKLTGFLLKNGFAQSASDYSLFTKWVHGRIVVLLVYVDDNHRRRCTKGYRADQESIKQRVQD
ncbi:unnamed protein product [Linum trigynum]|uniref:Reverse transcriptase Ty1/copia-type domain-containing protein n=1 Tax=Linum trigynum TaxID=586398 RepID=A0AAV2GWB5_9ROSI